ncbi:bifunctional UDP-sugar hydrolase/5'-nucleotidase [Bacteroidales bacterium]
MNILRLIFFGLLTGLTIIINGCGTARKLGHIPHVSETKTIEILAVNDIHANIDNFPRLAFIADSLRDLYPKLLMVSAGDNQTGNPVNDQYPERGAPVIELMNELNFDISAMGNHEFDTKPEALVLLLKKASFSFISANIHPNDTIAFPIKPYRLVHLPNGLTLGFVSVVEINHRGIPDSHPDNVNGFSFSNPTSTANQYLFLKDSCDVLIYLTHYGYENDVQLAQQFPQGVVDLIIGGHSHTKIDTEQLYNGVLITQAESRLKYASLIKMSIENDGKRHLTSSLLTVGNNGNINPKIQKMVEIFNDNPRLNTPIAIATDDFSNRDELGFLMVDALRASAQTEIALLNPGGVRLAHLPKGSITVKDVYLMDPFGNETILYRLTGHELKSLLTNAFRFDDYGAIIPSGMKTRYHLDQKGQLFDVELFTNEGVPMDLNRLYSVAMNSYMASVYVYEHNDPGTRIFSTTAESMIEYLRTTGHIPSYRDEQRVEISQ